MKIKIVIEADIDINEMKKNPILRVLKQLKKMDQHDPLPIRTTIINNDNIIQVHPTPPSDGILKF
jgi:hypothetical protein